MRRKNNTTIILFSDRDNKYSITFNQPPQKAVFKYYKGMKNLIIKENKAELFFGEDEAKFLNDNFSYNIVVNYKNDIQENISGNVIVKR